MKTFTKPHKAVEAAGGGDLEDLLADGKMERTEAGFGVREPDDWLIFSRSSREITDGTFTTKKQALRVLNLEATERRIRAGLYVADSEHVVGRRKVAAEEGFRAWPSEAEEGPGSVGEVAEAIRNREEVEGLDEQEALALNSAINKNEDVFGVVRPAEDGTFRITPVYTFGR